MVDDNTEVEVDVHVRPLLGHWKPISSQRKATTDYKEHLTSNGGLDSSVWKLSKKTGDGLSVSVSQSFKYILEDNGETEDTGKKQQKEEKKNEVIANLQCHWEAKTCSAKSTDRSSSTTYENPHFSFSETTGSTPSMKTNSKIEKVSAKRSDNKMAKMNNGNLKTVAKKSISRTRGRSPQKKLAIKTENKTKSPAKKKKSMEKKSLEESKKETKTVKMKDTPSVQRSDRKIVGDSKLSEEVSVVVPECRFGLFNISELKCWLLLAIFVAFVIVYRNQLVAECAEEC